VWAGVDHISTARSPFAPVAQPTPLDGNAAAAAAPATPPKRGGGGGGGAVAAHAQPPQPPPPPPHAPAPCVVTDPTLPSVTLDASWVPPALSALHAALTTCANFKVRIAAAQALGATPSRAAYRVPGSFSAPFSAPAAGEGGAGAGAGVHLCPALQRPGYDAWPSAVAGLVAALLRCEGAADFSEFRYKESLKCAIRSALLATLQLAEHMDYGRAKAFFDDNAALLLAWLKAEEALLVAAEAAGEGAAAAPAAAPPEALRTEDQPVRASPLPPFGVLAPHPEINLLAVRSAVVRLAGMYKSRVKSLPQPLLKAWLDEAAAAQATLGGKD
jgi:hypothetical protein